MREAEEVFINTQPHISQIVALLLQHYFINIIKKRKNIDSRGLLELKWLGIALVVSRHAYNLKYQLLFF